MWGKEILSFLKTEMNTPKPYGVFHMVCLGIMAVVIFILFCIRKRNNDKQLKYILGIYGLVALVLEALKQFIWTVDYDVVTNILLCDYQWYAAPFQLCTTPIYVCLICLFLKKGAFRDSLLSFMAYTTILGSIATAIIPNDVFVSDILINIHTMWLHLGSLAVSIYLIISKEVGVSNKDFRRAITVFAIFICIANTLNLVVYNSGILKGEEFNMFYISPYFKPTLPVFDVIYEKVPYIVFLAIYFVALTIGSYIIYLVAKLLSYKKSSVNIKRKIA